MNPKVWGKAGWKFLFSVALDYPTKPDFQQIHNYMRFFTYLQYVLPCAVCRINYTNHLNALTIDPYLTSRDNLFLWILKMNNLVNKQTGKPSLTRDDVMRIYFNNQVNVIDCRIDPRIWGKEGWKFLFSIAYEYPKNPSFQDILNYKRFFTYLQYVLPCQTYRTQYATQLDVLPIDEYLTTRTYLFKWVLEMHNLVNKEIGRPLLTHKDVIHFYFNDKILIDQHKHKNEPPYGMTLVERFAQQQNDTQDQDNIQRENQLQKLTQNQLENQPYNQFQNNPQHQFQDNTQDLFQNPLPTSDPTLFNKNVSLGILVTLVFLMFK